MAVPIGDSGGSKRPICGSCTICVDEQIIKDDVSGELRTRRIESKEEYGQMMER